jgi:hypothetical protein
VAAKIGCVPRVPPRLSVVVASGGYHSIDVRRWGVPSYRVRFEGSPPLALRVATALADAAGIELTSSDPPLNLADGKVALNVAVDGAFDAVADAVATIRGDLPSDASIEITAT